MKTHKNLKNLETLSIGGGAMTFCIPICKNEENNMIEDMKIFHKTYEFIKWLHTLLNKFPKSEKYTMAQKIENTSLAFLEAIIESNNDFDKKKSLQKAIIELDKLMESFNSWEAYMNHGNTYSLKNDLYRRYFKNVV